MGIMNSIFDSVESIKDSLADIKEEANRKGANITVADALNVWSQRIAGIPEAAENKVASDSNEQPVSVLVDGTFIFPTKDEDGEDFNRTWKFPSNFQSICNVYKKVVIPEWFTTANLSSLHLDIDGMRMQTLRCESQNIPEVTYAWNAMRDTFLRAEFPNYTSAADWNTCNYGGSGYAKTTPFSLIVPKASAIGGSWGKPGALLEVPELDASSATRVGNTNGNYSFFRFVKAGSWVFPACTEIIQIEQGEEQQTMRFPKLTKCSNTNQFRQNWSHGKFIWCIGKDLATLATQIATNINTAAGQIEVHIPAGASTTLTTLQTVGVNSQYIYQDYGTESLYPEDAQYFSE